MYLIKNKTIKNHKVQFLNFDTEKIIAFFLYNKKNRVFKINRTYHTHTYAQTRVSCRTTFKYILDQQTNLQKRSLQNKCFNFFLFTIKFNSNFKYPQKRFLFFFSLFAMLKAFCLKKFYFI